MRKSKLLCPVCGKHLCRRISCRFCEYIAPKECYDNDIQNAFGYCTCGDNAHDEYIVQQQQESKRLKHINQILHAEIQELKDALIKNP